MSVAQPPNNKVVTSVTLAAGPWVLRASVYLGATRVSCRMRLRLGFESGRNTAVGGVDGHGNAEMGAGVFTVDDFDGAAVRRDKLEHDGQADAGAFDRGALRGATGIESFEHVLTILHGDTGPVVGHVEHELRTGGARFQVNRASLRGVLDAVRPQVLEKEANLAAIRNQGDIVHAHI